MHSSLARQLALPVRPGCADPGRVDRSGSLRCRAEAAPPASVSRTGPHTGRDPEAKKPAWLRQRAAQGGKYARMRESLGELKLNTVCVEAQCPNIGECWNGGPFGELPPELLPTILSNLDVKHAARTSLLSSAWRHAWKQSPKLTLDIAAICGDGYKSSKPGAFW